MTELKKVSQRDIALDYIRILAMLMIVFCHFFQIIHCIELAFWLNIGVQLFLILSAKLLCHKTFNSRKDVVLFYRTRVLRIMLPVWIYLAVISLGLWIIKQPPSATALVAYAFGGAAFIKSGVLGLGHFWYISIILIAYLFVPLLSLFRDKIQKLKTGVFFLLALMLFLLLMGIFFLLGNASYGVHLSLFIICYYGFQRQHALDWRKKGIKYTFIPAALLVVVRIILDIVGVAEWTYYALYDVTFVPICKAVLGYFLFCLLHLLFSIKAFQKFEKSILYLSTISFEVYITHQFIELAVHEYVPYCNNGTLLGGLLMLIVSMLLIAMNTLLLHYAVVLLQKGVKAIRK